MNAKQNRDAAMRAVAHSNNEWMSNALKHLRRYATGNKSVTGEDIRLHLSTLKRVGSPKHHNAWGPLVRQAIRYKIIKPTKQFTNMGSPRSHARATRIYTW